MATTPDSGSSTHAISMSDLAGEILLAAELAVTSDEELEKLLTENPMLPCSSAMERGLAQLGSKPLAIGILEPECLDFIRLVLQAGRPGEAKRLCLKALKWQPACSALWEYQADAEDQLGEHDVAVRLRIAAAHCGEPESTTKRGAKASITWILHGGALIGRGEFKAARTALDRAYALSKDNEDRELAMGTLEILVHLREAVLAEIRKDRALDRSVMMGTTQEANLLRDAIAAGDLASIMTKTQ